jgi:sarcosine oxidase subunit gamma
MDEARVSPLHGWCPPPLTGIRLAELPPRTQVNLRLPGKGPAADAVGLDLGVPLPMQPGTTGRAGELSVLWLGPDEWLVLGPAGADIERRLRSRVGAGPASVVDVSASRTTIEVSGPRAVDLLAHGCALDLHPTRFPTGRCAQTLVAQAQVILVAADREPSYHLLVRSSFARYLAQWLEDAAVEYH